MITLYHTSFGGEGCITNKGKYMEIIEFASLYMISNYIAYRILSADCKKLLKAFKKSEKDTTKKF